MFSSLPRHFRHLQSQSLRIPEVQRPLKRSFARVMLSSPPPSRCRYSSVRKFSISASRRKDSRSSMPNEPTLADADHGSDSNSSSITTNEPPSVATDTEPKMQISFTCDVKGCGFRQHHTFSKRSYERGVVLVQCAMCSSRHLIADHLGWFKDLTKDGKHVDIEGLAYLHGKKITRGRVDGDGVIEYIDDSSESKS